MLQAAAYRVNSHRKSPGQRRVLLNLKIHFAVLQRPESWLGDTDGTVRGDVTSQAQCDRAIETV